MIFQIRNLGLVEYADIEVKGLTIITGLNDTGKSFISKAIYSVIKTINESNEQAVSEKYEQVNNLILQIYQNHRQIVPFTGTKLQQFNPNDLSAKVFNSLVSKVANTDIIGMIGEYKSRVVDDIAANASASLKANVVVYTQRIEIHFNNIISLLNDEGDEERKFKGFFDKVVIQKLFQGQINNASQKGGILSIKVSEGETELLSISVRDNKSQSFKLTNPLLVNDATIIETPTIVQLAKFITTTLAFPTTLKKLHQQRSELPYPYYDLLEKMNTSSNITDIYLEISNDIKKIIGGQLIFKVDEGSFVFAKENGTVIRSFNIATGIKSFGLIQLLLNSGVINQRKILIIDEPEVHLHPKWEIEYARFIVTLSKAGIPIVISSHSPYFLQAINKNVKELDTENITKFYFGKVNPEKATTYFEDITEDLEPTFTALAEPMRDIYL